VADNGALFDAGLFAAQAEHLAEQRLSASAPLAVRMRPATLEEVVGQDHLLASGSPLRRLVEGGCAASVILYASRRCRRCRPGSRKFAP
jgi:putative ATPase